MALRRARLEETGGLRERSTQVSTAAGFGDNCALKVAFEGSGQSTLNEPFSRSVRRTDGWGSSVCAAERAIQIPNLSLTQQTTAACGACMSLQSSASGCVPDAVRMG